jgi:hypothetical protein
MRDNEVAGMTGALLPILALFSIVAVAALKASR